MSAKIQILLLQTLVSLILLLSIANPSSAESQFGSWLAGPTDDYGGVYAATVNKSGALLGQYCLSETGECIWLLGNDIGCEEDSSIPALGNTDGGAFGLTISCLKVNGKSRYVVKEFHLINAAIANSSKLTIAFPLQSGLFQVNRFSLDGAERAISYMRGVSEKANVIKNKETTDVRFQFPFQSREQLYR
jgi:hypothetical protein